MPDGAEQYSLKTINRIEEVGREAWDRCAGTDNPFVSYDFLHALEASGSVGDRSGWHPQHLVVEQETSAGPGGIVGVVPAYLKAHSYGEYVFDHGWADAYERAGGQYYPKLQISVPFTPATGPRLLTAPGQDADAVRRLLLGALTQVAEKLELSGAHITFMTEDEATAAAEAGFLIRHGMQFHWHNHGYQSFDDFLAALSSRKRKAIRKERREVSEAGITVRALSGDDLKAADWDIFHRFYVDTYDRKWGYPYLTRAFFSILAETMGDRVVLMMAERNGTPVAGALNLAGTDALFGRNWGCAADFKFLHFETCYYRAIDVAIERGLSRVEAGTQGPHKIQRGYLPVLTYSAHWLRDQGFSEAVARFLSEEKRGVAYEIEALGEHSPYRKDPSAQTMP